MAFLLGLCGPAQSVFHQKDFRQVERLCLLCLLWAGDLGGSIGPGIVGRVTQSAGDNIRAGMGVGLLFPVILLIVLFIFARQKNNK